jgi:hypothetical protein
MYYFILLSLFISKGAQRYKYIFDVNNFLGRNDKIGVSISIDTPPKNNLISITALEWIYGILER